MFIGPVLDARILAIAPQFRALSIFADAGIDALHNNGHTDFLTDACKAVLAGQPDWADAHLASWNEVFIRFGARPNKTPSSAYALRKRVLKEGRVPSINPVVDLYNAVSLRFAIPVGGEDYDAYVGRPHLTIADGSEPFDTVVSGEAVIEHPSPGEVVWRDELGVTCRRWNWRQGTRTRLEKLSGRMWFVMEALETMPEKALWAAGDTLCEGLRQLMPACEILREEVSVVGTR